MVILEPVEVTVKCAGGGGRVLAPGAEGGGLQPFDGMVTRIFSLAFVAFQNTSTPLSIFFPRALRGAGFFKTEFSKRHFRSMNFEFAWSNTLEAQRWKYWWWPPPRKKRDLCGDTSREGPCGSESEPSRSKWKPLAYRHRSRCPCTILHLGDRSQGKLNKPSTLVCFELT